MDAARLAVEIILPHADQRPPRRAAGRRAEGKAGQRRDIGLRRGVEFMQARREEAAVEMRIEPGRAQGDALALRVGVGAVARP